MSESITPREQEIRNLPRQDYNASDVEYLLRLLDAERAKVARLASALERTEGNFRLAIHGHPVRDMAENLAENAAALAERPA